jgi:tetratricopeptide (TPR) repeat protein
MTKFVRTQYVPLLLAAATMGIYCFSLVEISLKPAVIGMDDSALFQSLLNHNLPFRDIILADNPGKYFRPFLTLSFLIEQKIWGEIVFGYRFTNVVLHTCNALLVYAIGMTLLRSSPQRNEVSFGAALLFAVHPLAVESTAWISGRTDLLSTFWALLAFYLYLSAHDRNLRYLYPFALFAAMTAAVSKENGFMVFILIISWELYFRRTFQFPPNRFALISVIMILAVGILYVVLRTTALASKDMSMAMIWSGLLSGDLVTPAQYFSASYGFYIKKFIDPFPLQFAIDSIAVGSYAIIGVFILLFFGITLLLPSMVSYRYFYFWALLGLLPSAVISFTNIAWTPWAERYLYFSMVPLSFMSSMLCVYLMDKWHGIARNATYAFAAGVLLVFAISTVQRTHVWNNDLLLAEDTYKKSPSFIYAAVEYGRALKEKGMISEAEQQLREAVSLAGPKHRLYYQLGDISFGKGDYEGAREQFRRALYEARNDRRLVLLGPVFKKNILISLSRAEFAEGGLFADRKTRDRYDQTAIGYLIEAYKEDPSDSFLLYNIAKMKLAVGNTVEAAHYFEEFIKKRCDNDIYRQTAERLLKKIRLSAVIQ